MAQSNTKSSNPSVLGLSLTPTANRDSHADTNPAVNRVPSAGKTVFVTGAARGVGQATAISFAAAGADRIAIVDHLDTSATRSRAIKAAADAGRPAPEILALEIDVCDFASVEAGIKEVSLKWGHVDILINSTSDLSPSKPEPLGASSMDAWWRTWEVNVKGVYLIVRTLLPLLLQGTEKTVVNVASVGSLELTPGASTYQLSQLAVMRLSECLMLDYAHDGLLAYSVHPALDLAKEMPEVASKADQPEQAGEAIVYLTNRRREWLAGRHISSAWDMRQFMARKDEIIRKDLLKLKISIEEPAHNEIHVPYQGIRGRVPRNSY